MGFNDMTKEEWREKEDRERRSFFRQNAQTNATNLVVAMVEAKILTGTDEDVKIYFEKLRNELEGWLNRD